MKKKVLIKEIEAKIANIKRKIASINIKNAPNDYAEAMRQGTKDGLEYALYDLEALLEMSYS